MKQPVTLTAEQIDFLFAFCRKHYVHYYDVQVELVDHLANAIEEKMTKQAQLSFERALDEVYAGFGIRGFVDIVASHTLFVKKQCRKLYWKQFLSYFTWPRIAMATCLLTSLLSAGEWLVSWQKGVVLAVYATCLFVFDVFLIRLSSRSIKKQISKLLITEISTKYFFLLSFLLPNFLGRSLDLSTENIWRNDMRYPEYAVVTTLLTLLLIAKLSYGDMLKTMNQQALKMYPRAFAQL